MEESVGAEINRLLQTVLWMDVTFILDTMENHWWF
jgi:hypothetical protein